MEASRIRQPGADELARHESQAEAEVAAPPHGLQAGDLAGGLRRLDPGMRAAIVGGLQRGRGNQFVQRLAHQAVAREPAPAEAPAAPTEAPTSLVDSEGNAVDTTGRPHLTAIPAAVHWHRGVPQALPPDPVATYDRLRGECAALAKKQDGIARSLKGDMKYWFARVYSFVTMYELQQIDAGVYEYPLAKLQQVIAFHATYERNLENWKQGARSQVEPNWVAAFSAAEAMNSGATWRNRAWEIMLALLPSMQAHIRFDLPRAVASVYENEYAGIPGLSPGHFKPDYEAMAAVFDLSTAAVAPEIEAECYFIDPGAWPRIRALGFPLFFDLPIERQLTWEKAALIIDAHQKGILKQPDVQKHLKAEILGTHPESGPDSFEVDDIEVTFYDWNAQP